MAQKTLTLTSTAKDAAQAAALLTREIHEQLVANGYREFNSSESGRGAVAQMSATLAAAIMAGNLKTENGDLGVANIAF